MSKTAILGGSFDPVHLAHLSLIHNTALQTSYNHFILIPAKVSNYKIDSAPRAADEDRLSMLSLSVDDYKDLYPKDNVEVSVSDMEIARGGISYTYDTVIELKKQLGMDKTGERLGFIIGDDHIERLSGWCRYEDLKKEVEFIICPRSGDSLLWSKLDKDLRYIKLKLNSTYAENSTAIRTDALKNANFMSQRVRAYVFRNTVYTDKLHTLQELNTYLKYIESPKRYTHSLGVAITVQKILDRYSLKAETENWNGYPASIFVGLCHDIAREWKDTDLNKYCHEHSLSLDSDEEAYPVLSHGIVSAHIAKKLLGDYPEEWKRAIDVHTSGSDNMGVLSMALFSADFIEPSRLYLTDEKREYYLSKPTLEECTYSILLDIMEHWKTRINITPTAKTLAMKDFLAKKTGH